jgi:hypothetical protein
MARHDLRSDIRTAAEMTSPARGHRRHHPRVLGQLGQQLPADALQKMSRRVRPGLDVPLRDLATWTARRGELAP